MKLIQAINIFLLASSLLWIQNSHACSIQVNHQYEKNILVALAASEMRVDLSKATRIQVADYHLLATGGTGADCPTHLNTDARITVNYDQNLLVKCSFSVTVSRRLQIGEVPILTEPMEVVNTALPVSGCTRIPLPAPTPRRPF